MSAARSSDPTSNLRAQVSFVALAGLTLLAELAQADQHRLLFLGPSRAVVVEVSFNDSAISIDKTRRRYSDGVMARLDLDRDGVLNPEEAHSIPADGHLQSGGPTVDLAWESIDKTPQDNQVSSDELYDFINRQMGPRMTVRRFIKQQRSVRLYDDLDLNKDARIDQLEVAEGLSRLRAFDFDDDETLSVAELQPFPQAVLQAQRQADLAEEPLPLVTLDSEESIAEAARRVLEGYKRSDSDGLLLRDPAVLNVREAIFKRFDADKDGAWKAAELAKYLKLIPGEIVLQVMLTRRSVVLSSTREEGADPREGLDFGGMTVKCRANNRADMRTNLVNLLKTFALQTDADKNRYLDASEFAAFQGQAQGQITADFTFEAVDLDRNQQVTIQEIGDYFVLDALYGQGRFEATLSDDAITLFEIIDGESAGSRDRRLSLRDFQEGAQRLNAYDANGDGALSPGEIVSDMMISFSQPEILNYGARNAPPTPTAQQMNVPQQLSGPLWFRRMDRNQDADLTWNEFLGPREAFRGIDANGDGFITLDEAEMAGAASSAPAP